jgi:WD40 repeat protein
MQNRTTGILAAVFIATSMISVAGALDKAASKSAAEAAKLSEAAKKSARKSTQPRPQASAVPELKSAQKTNLQSPRNHGGFHSFAFSSDGKTIAGGTGVGTVTVRNRKTALGGEVVLWDARTGRLQKTLGGHGESVTWVAYSRDGKTLASGSSENGLVKAWNMPSGQLKRTLNIKQRIGSNVGFSPFLVLSADGRAIVTVTEKVIEFGKSRIPTGGELIVWDLETGKKKWSLPDSDLKALDLSPDGKTLAGYVAKMTDLKANKQGDATWFYDSELLLWNAESGELQHTIDQGRRTVKAITYMPDGKTLAFADNSGLTLRDAETGETTREIKWDRNRWAFSKLAFSSEGRTLGRAWTRWGVEFLNVETGAVEGLFAPEFEEALWNVHFSHDLKHVACTQTASGALVVDFAPAASNER